MCIHQVHLVDLHTVEALVRLLDQWTVEQGQLVLEYALLTMIHLLTVEEARFRLYLTGVYRPFRSIVLGDEGASAEAREKAVLCAWFLFEWQVEKLEILDRKVCCCRLAPPACRCSRQQVAALILLSVANG